MFWIGLFLYFLGAKIMEYLLVSSHSIRVGRLERPVFSLFTWMTCILWPLAAVYLWVGSVLVSLFGKPDDV